MATTRKTTTTTRRRATPKSSPASAPRAKADPSLAARTGRTVKERPYVSAAIATGAVTAVAAVAAGAYFFSRRDQSIGETADELTSRVKDGLAEAKTRVAGYARKARDRFDSTPAKTRKDFAAKALTLKEIGDTDDRRVDPVVADQLKAGAVSY